MPELADLERRADDFVARRDLASALAQLLRARTLAEEGFGATSARYAQVLDRLGRLQMEMANPDSAALLFEESLGIYDEVYTPTHEEVRNAIERLIHACVARRDVPRGDALLARLYKGVSALNGPQHAASVAVRYRRGQFYAELGDHPRARAILLGVVSELERITGLEDPETAAACTALVKATMAMKRLGEAEEICKRLLAVQREQYGVEYVATRRTFRLLADIRDEMEASDDLEDPPLAEMPDDPWPELPKPERKPGSRASRVLPLSPLFRRRATRIAAPTPAARSVSTLVVEQRPAADSALQDIDRRIAGGPTPALLNSRGVLKARAGDFEGAHSDFSQALKLERGYNPARINRFVLLISQGRDDDAYAMIDSIAQSSNDNAVPHVQSAMLQRRKGYHKQALVDLCRAVVADFTRVVAEIPASDSSRQGAQAELSTFHRATAHLATSRLEDAWWECDELLSRNRKNFHAVALRGIFTGIMGNYSRAYDQIDEPGPEMGRAEPLVLLVRGLLLDLLGYPEDADLEIEAARKVGPALLEPALEG